ncbi:MAG: ribulose-phosphate 3-epimerase [Eubacteriales bacterium]|nr:ribulose-phosphate 3-epimerase [Eubacteriales bacterium]
MQRKIRILPSLASANQMCLGEQIQELGEYPFLHMDVEDGNFVPNITFGIKTIREAAKYSGKELDIHLMVSNPLNYIDDLLDIGAKAIAFHLESVSYPAVCLQRIRQGGAKAGLAFNFMAQPKAILPYIEDVDYVLIMTSEPDGRGQEFRPGLLKKIEEARSILPDRISIMADGGVSEETMEEVARRGADTLVMGRAIWQAPNAGKQVERLLKKLNGG